MDNDQSPHQQQLELEQLERLLTPVQRPLPGPLVAPASAPAASSRRPGLGIGGGRAGIGVAGGGVGHAPFVSPASVAQLYGFTPSSASGNGSASAGTFENKLPDLALPALALPAPLAGSGSSSLSGSGSGVGVVGMNGDTARVEEAYQYVLNRERGALEHLLARIAHGSTTLATRLHHALRVRTRGAEEARMRVERALGRWVVHEHTLAVVQYDPARAEAEVLARARAHAQSKAHTHAHTHAHEQAKTIFSAAVYQQFKDSIRAHAEQQKELLKVELDARRAALQGVFNDKHAKAVNNQKSAHLSKFLAAQIAHATDLLVQWLADRQYS